MDQDSQKVFQGRAGADCSGNGVDHLLYLLPPSRQLLGSTETCTSQRVGVDLSRSIGVTGGLLCGKGTTITLRRLQDCPLPLDAAHTSIAGDRIGALNTKTVHFCDTVTYQQLKLHSCEPGLRADAT